MSLLHCMEIIPEVEEGGFSIVYPDLPGCITCAETLEGILSNVEDVKWEWIMAALLSK